MLSPDAEARSTRGGPATPDPERIGDAILHGEIVNGAATCLILSPFCDVSVAVAVPDAGFARGREHGLWCRR